ncbi:MAG: AEC family transporter [Clostridia bacterium]|nr:AEC family transporter [Clostridia bacterium]
MLFFSYASKAFGQVSILAVMVVLGFICDKVGLFTQRIAKDCNNLLFYIITPAVVIHSFLNVEFNTSNAASFLVMALIMLVFHAGGALILRFCYRKSGEDRPIFQYASVYGNVGYMGLPLAEAVAGAEGVFYCSAAVVVFNVFAFTHGIGLMQRGKEKIALSKMLINPGTIGIMVGLPLCCLKAFLKVELPELFLAPIGYISNLNTPMAMLMFGTYLANTDLPGMFRQKENYLVALMKLILFPGVMLTAAYLLGVRGQLLLAAAVACSAPTANNTVMFAAKYDRDIGIASKASGFASVLSIVTMPIFIALADLLG